MPEAYTSIEIAASPEHIWSVLMDLASWPSWNTFVVSIQVQPPHKELAVGSTQDIKIATDPNNLNVTESYTNTVTELEPARKLVWQGTLGASVILNVEHWATLEPVAGSSPPRTTFSQGERFKGLLAPVIGLTSKVQQLETGYERMNQELKELCEKDTS